MFAEAKEWHGMRRFRLRRLEKVNSEALMIASGQNIKRLVSFGSGGPKKTAMVAALRPPEKPPPYPIRQHPTIPARRFSTGWGEIGSSVGFLHDLEDPGRYVQPEDPVSQTTVFGSLDPSNGVKHRATGRALYSGRQQPPQKMPSAESESSAGI